ncbi:transmembrane protein C1orf162 homolog [Nycticebus coucang]|uniref:transmembrane protein C1orf162 homolog n=1 Tax=Nycticebus coucang TaxID=9470 RepID=UPI00234D765F|nr:transmembrane protein C1orf162 homolog [Nycticebus coucang]XP_053447733.1 transmembrane protein C1orf162 homolog [Nycticebus coucang]
MGRVHSTPKTDTGKGQSMSTTPTPMTRSTSWTSWAPCPSNVTNQNSKNDLILAFSAGVLLTLLLVVLVFLIIKGYRKCHPSPQALKPHSDLPAKLPSVSEESLTYASMTFKILEEKGNHLTKNCSADLDPIVYDQIKASHSPCLSSEP